MTAYYCCIGISRKGNTGLGKRDRSIKGKPLLARLPVVSTPAVRYPIWPFLIVGLVAAGAYLQTLSFQFVYDDTYQIMQNPWIQSGSNIGRFFTTDVWAFTGRVVKSNYYRPLQMVIYTAAHSIGGLAPVAFHGFNIILHAICCVWISLIGQRLTGSKWIALTAGLLFALHPIHVESVAWIAAIVDPLCAAFYFGALYFYLKSIQQPESLKPFIASAVLFAGALLSKEMAFTFPVAALWLDWSLQKKFRWQRYAVFAIIFAAYAVMRIRALGAFAVHQFPAELSLFSQVLSTIVLLAQYLQKMFVPYGMNAFHVFHPTISLLEPQFLLSLASLAAFGIAAWFLRRQSVALFLCGFAFLAIIPVLNITGVGENVFADRYLYIPSLASCLLIALAVERLSQPWHSREVWKAVVHPPSAAIVLCLAVFAWLTWHETAIWKNNPTLYLATMERSPKAAAIAHNLASLYYDSNDLQRAEYWENKALTGWQEGFAKNKTLHAQVFSGYGGIRFKQGRISEAQDFYMKAYAEAPYHDELLQNIGIFFTGTRQYPKALEFLQQTVRLNPRRAVAYSNMAGIYAVYGKWDPAIANARQALEIDPKLGEALVNLAYSYAGKGMKEEARQAYMMLKQVDPSRSSLADNALKLLGSR
jgi:tetratricopeptide (TPR) repeat protein